MDKDMKKEEYNCIRTEMLSNMEKAFSFWKWGLASLFSLNAPVLYMIAERNHDNIIYTSFAENPVLLSSFLMLTSFCVIVAFSWIIYRIEDAVDRMGSYLVVFHEDPSNSNYSYGWHISNRIEKNSDKTESPTETPSNIVHSQDYIKLFYIFQVLFIVLLLGLVPDSQETTRFPIFLLGLFCLLVIFFFHWIFSENFNRPNYWNERWTEISEYDNDKIEKELEKIGLETKKS